jgi:hypothetical protein
VTLVFHPLAERELIAAARFYETHASGLGADFIRQVERTLADVVAHLNAGVLFAGSAIRRRLMLTSKVPPQTTSSSRSSLT